MAEINNLKPEIVKNKSGEYIAPITIAESVFYRKDDGTVESLSGRIDNSAGWDNLIIGAIQLFSGDTMPTGFLHCDGSAISRTSYPNLFKAIGTKYGTGDGSTTFNIPWIADNGDYKWIIKAQAITTKPEVKLSQDEFNSLLSTSNLAETGTFLPKYKIATWNQEGNTDYVTYNVQVGHYYRIGNYVNINFTIDCTNLASVTSVTNGWACVNISDCPYTPFRENGTNELWPVCITNGAVDTTVKGFGTTVTRIGLGPGFGQNLIISYGSAYNRASYTDFKESIYCSGTLGFTIDPPPLLKNQNQSNG